MKSLQSFFNLRKTAAYTVIGGDIMGLFNCNCKAGCTALGVLVSLVAGIAALVLTITGTITVLPVFVWAAFGIAVGALLLAFLVAAFADECGKRECGCICRALSTLQFGALGTILTAFLLLVVDFGAISTIGAIVYGAFFFFFVLLIASISCLTRCYANCGD